LVKIGIIGRGKLELKTIQTITTDVLVIGGGGAGLRAAIEARKYGLDVVLVSESPVGFKNNTAISGAAFAASGIRKEPGDSPDVHIKDTMNAGRFINDRRLVAALARGATQQVYDLIKFGVNFKRDDGELFVMQAPGHTYPRAVATEIFVGHHITRPMRQYAASAGIQFMEGIPITKLLRVGDTVVGALGIGDKGQVFVFNAKSTILATGGAGGLYLRTDNAVGLNGIGYALAYEVGATLRDMEFVQYYATAWGKHGRKIYDYETLVPRGATIRNSLGEDILKRRGMGDFSLVTRDIMARVIMEEIVEGRGIEGNVIIDFSTIPQDKVPELYGCGLVSKGGGYPEKVQVAPTVHFFMGGIEINESSETGIDGLYAAGEVCGGIHGANRLGNNAITEILVFGTIAGDKAATRASKMNRIPASQSKVAAEVERLIELASGRNHENLEQLQWSLKQTMWDKVGVIRNKKSLEDAQREILTLREQLGTVSLTDYRQLSQAVKLANMLTVSEMICSAALTRTESRGAHYRTDYPEENNKQWLKNIEISSKNRHMTLKVIPVQGAEGYRKLG